MSARTFWVIMIIYNRLTTYFKLSRLGTKPTFNSSNSPRAKRSTPSGTAARTTRTTTYHATATHTEVLPFYTATCTYLSILFFFLFFFFWFFSFFFFFFQRMCSFSQRMCCSSRSTRSCKIVYTRHHIGGGVSKIIISLKQNED